MSAAATSKTPRAVIGLPARGDARIPPPGAVTPPVVRPETRGGRESMAALRRRVESFRVSPTALDVLNDTERRELDLLAFGYQRKIDRRREAEERAATLRRFALRAARTREPGLVASMGASAEVQTWAGVIGAEGRLTGDGRIIEHAALSWAALPLPLRYVAADVGGHEGAMLVGRIDAIQRSDDGLIVARGVLDLGSELGREAVRLIGLGMLGGVSMDLDSTSAAASTLADGASASVMSTGRVRAATLVAIPAFDEARIVLVDEDNACDCDPWGDLFALEPFTE